MIRRFEFDRKSTNHLSKQFPTMRPSLKAALRRLARISLRGERISALYFSNDDVIMELEQKLWGRIQLVFKGRVHVDVGCKVMPANWLYECWDYESSGSGLLKLLVQFDQGNVALAFDDLQIQPILAEKTYLKTLENQFATDAIMGGHSFDYAAFFRTATTSIRSKQRFCGTHRLRMVERDLLHLEHFALTQMNELFRGRLTFDSCSNALKCQRLNPVRWEKIRELVIQARPASLAELMLEADQLLNQARWGSEKWHNGFQDLTHKFESLYGDFGIHADPIYESFCRYTLERLELEK